MKTKYFFIVICCLLTVALMLTPLMAAKKEVKEKELKIKTETEAAVEKKGKMAVPTDPKYGGVLRFLSYVTSIEPASWDPADCLWSTGFFCSPYLPHLIMGDLQKGRRGTGEFSFMPNEFLPEGAYRGDLAESWEIQPDRLTFHIRRGVYWTGKPGVMASREVTADDVVFALGRYDKSPKSSPARLGWIDSMEATDKYTVEMKLNKFHGNWGYLLAWGWSTHIYPPELVKAGINDWRNAVSAGPWILADYVPGSSINYERNPNYWRQTVVGGKEYKIPFLDKVYWPIIPDESTQIAALRTGKVDIAESVSWKFKKSLAKSRPELTMWRYTDTSPMMIAMRNDTKPFDDIKVRRAMNLAVKNQAIINTQFGGCGVLKNLPFHSDFPKSLYTPLEKCPESVRELYEYHPEKAKKLLAEAGYPDGFETEMVVRNYPDDIDQVSMVLHDWAKIGVKCKLKQVEYGALHSAMHGQTHKQMLAIGKGSDCTGLAVLRSIGLCGQWWNPAIYCDPEFEEKYEKAKRTVDVAERNKLLKELEISFLKDAPYVILPDGCRYRYAWPWVENYWAENTTGYFDRGQIWATIWIDQKKKKEMGYK